MQTRTFLAMAAASACLLAAGCGGAEEPVRANGSAALEIRKGLVSGEAGDGGTAAAAATGTGWGTLRGSFKLDPSATPRQALALTVDKDTAVCAPGGKTVFDSTMLVDSGTRGIKNVLVFARRVNRVHELAEPDESEEIFDQKECIFLTRVFPIRVGQTMRILNSDPVGHNTKIDARSGVSTNLLIEANGQATFKPTAEETLPVPVSCSIHPWMSAYCIPRKNGYFAVTAEDGSFEIPNLPAGEDIEFQVWHENATGPGGALPVENAAPKIDSKGRFKLKLQADGEQVLDIVVPGASFRT